jgi:hypothetical protein
VKKRRVHLLAAIETSNRRKGSIIMRITLEKGENLEVVIVEKEKIIGKLSLQLLGSVQIVEERRVVASAPEAAFTQGEAPQRKRRKRQLSPEARERLAEAQRRRWARARAQSAGQQGGGEQSGQQ